MSIEKDQPWQWSHLDPLTRSVVAAFSWKIGDESQGDLSSDGFIGAMTESFADLSTEDVIKTASWGGPEGMHNTIINKLHGFDDEPVTGMLQQLGHLAGSSETAVSLAAQAGDQLRGTNAYDAIPVLRALSEMALERRQAS